MFGISDEHIIEEVAGPWEEPEYDPDRAVTLRYNQPDPFAMTDGVDRITVVEKSDDEYLLHYWGFESGYLVVTGDGVRELGESRLGDSDDITGWHLRLADDSTIPWWVPDTYDGEPTVACDYCRTEIPAGDVLAPGSFDGEVEARLCQECWDEVRNRWHPERGLVEIEDRDHDREIPRTVTIRSDPLAKAGLLSQREADVFVYRAVEKLSRAEVARQMDISESTVAHELIEARRTIKQADETVELVRELTDRFDAETIYSEEE